MSLGVRGKQPGRTAPRLLLAGPGGQPPAMVATKWRAVAGSPGGDLPPEDVVATIRVSPMAGKQDKTLLAAMASDDIEAIRELAEGTGDLVAVAGLMLGLRLAADQPVVATHWLTAAVTEGKAPWDHKFMRRYLPTLHVCALLAPGVPAVLQADQEAVTLLLAEMITAQGRHLDTVSLLGQQPLTPLIGLALAATYLSIGQNEAVVKLTDGLANLDDLTALCLVARGVALRSSGRMEEALSAFDLAIHEHNRHPGMVSAALEERAHLLSLTGDELAAQADRERIAALEGGALPSSLSVRGGSAQAGEAPAPAEAPTPVALDPITDASAMSAARTRVRRHIAMTGAPGTFGGRHHRTYQPEVEAMLAAGQLDAAESLLLGLIDAVEDEAEVSGIAIDSTFYLTLADLFTHRGDSAEHIAVMERYHAACDRFGVLSDVDDLAEAAKAVDEATVVPSRDGYFNLAEQHVG